MYGELSIEDLKAEVEESEKAACLAVVPWTNPRALHIHGICVCLFISRKGGNFAASSPHFLVGRELHRCLQGSLKPRSLVKRLISRLKLFQRRLTRRDHLKW